MSLNRFLLSFRRVAILVAFWVCLVAGCNDSGPVPAKGEAGLSYQVIAVSYPLQYLTERIAGDSINVILPIPADIKDPQNWRPTREAIGQMQTADLIFANGTGAKYANWLTTISLPDSHIRNTASRGLSLSDYIAVLDVTVVHSHGPEGEHSHATMVARTWLDPKIAKKQATYIAAELANVYPDQSDEFAKNLKSLNSQLDQLSEQIESIKTNQSNLFLISATPKLKFFTRAAGAGELHLTWFEMPGSGQASSDLKKILEHEGPQPTLVLFDNVLPNEEIRMILKQNGLRPLAIDLIDRQPASGDFLSALRANIEALAAALEG